MADGFDNPRNCSITNSIIISNCSIGVTCCQKPVKDNIYVIISVKTAKNEWKKLRDGHRESLKRMKTCTSGQAAPPKNNWKYANLLEFLLPYMKNRPRSGNANESQNNATNNPVEVGMTNERQDTTNTSMEVQNAMPEDNEHISVIESMQSPSQGSVSSEQRQRKRKANEDSLHDLLKDIDSDFENRREIRDKKRAEEAEEMKKNRHPMNLFFDSMCETTKNLPDWLQRQVKKKVFEAVSEAEDTYEKYIYGNQYNTGYSTSSGQSTPHSQDVTLI